MKNTAFFKALLCLFAAIVVLQILPGCAIKKEVPPLPTLALKKVHFSASVAFSDDLNFDGLNHCIEQSIAYLKRLPPDKQFRFGNDLYTSEHIILSLTRFSNFIEKKPDKKELKKFVRRNYTIYRSVGMDQKGTVLFTGYYEPALRGSLKRSDEYRYPVYARPDNLLTIELSQFSAQFKNKKIFGRVEGQTVVPYYDRAEVEKNDFLLDYAEPLAWVNNRVDLFFLQIQGSGKIILDDGSTMNVHYHASNGRPYRSIGKLLIEQGKIEKSKMSMQAIRSYLKNNPSELDAVLNYNPSYIFFKLEDDGPFGSLDVKLTPGRSIALDRRVFPAAALAFMETKLPLVTGDGKIQDWSDCSRFVLNQDTGGAIRGPGRADLFWGDGPYAELAAGHMQHSGKLYFLVLKPKE